jgi:glycosyltransferase involved in cell wall biosynthesis
MAPTVSVLIPTHNRNKRLAELLDALSSEPVRDIVVVVNGSQDGSLEILEERAKVDSRLKPLSIDGASQFRALQLAAEYATGDVVLMLDDDVIPEPGLVAGHARHHVAADDLVVLGYMPVALPAQRKPAEYPLHLYHRAYEGSCAEYERDPSTILRGYWAGNGSLCRATALRVGLAPSADLPGPYSAHCDRDFGLRCEAAGLRGVFDRSLRAVHKHKRPPAVFARWARGSGYNQWVIHRVHADVIGSLPCDYYERGVPVHGRPLVRWARRPAAHKAIQFLLGQAVAVAGFMRLFGLESYAGHLIGTIEEQRGALEAARTVGPMLEEMPPSTRPATHIG